MSDSKRWENEALQGQQPAVRQARELKHLAYIQTSARQCVGKSGILGKSGAKRLFASSGQHIVVILYSENVTRERKQLPCHPLFFGGGSGSERQWRSIDDSLGGMGMEKHSYNAEGMGQGAVTMIVYFSERL